MVEENSSHVQLWTRSPGVVERTLDQLGTRLQLSKAIAKRGCLARIESYGSSRLLPVD